MCWSNAFEILRNIFWLLEKVYEMVRKSFWSSNKDFYSYTLEMVFIVRTFLTLWALFHLKRLRIWCLFLKKLRNSWLLFSSFKFCFNMEQFLFSLSLWWLLAPYIIIYSCRKPVGTCNQMEILANVPVYSVCLLFFHVIPGSYFIKLSRFHEKFPYCHSSFH